MTSEHSVYSELMNHIQNRCNVANRVPFHYWLKLVPVLMGPVNQMREVLMCQLRGGQWLQRAQKSHKDIKPWCMMSLSPHTLAVFLCFKWLKVILQTHTVEKACPKHDTYSIHITWTEQKHWTRVIYADNRQNSRPSTIADILACIHLHLKDDLCSSQPTSLLWTSRSCYLVMDRVPLPLPSPRKHHPEMERLIC
jgi:hypothetical protein